MASTQLGRRLQLIDIQLSKHRDHCTCNSQIPTATSTPGQEQQTVETRTASHRSRKPQHKSLMPIQPHFTVATVVAKQGISYTKLGI